ncbi:hypothetical protein [Embleya sp. NPDC059237]|uniref:hypothetical protein n=1 Tax=Embleya sp. NPDC059237 TaxID=3346784 RepID=UPI00368DF782
MQSGVKLNEDHPISFLDALEQAHRRETTSAIRAGHDTDRGPAPIRIAPSLGALPLRIYIHAPGSDRATNQLIAVLALSGRFTDAGTAVLALEALVTNCTPSSNPDDYRTGANFTAEALQSDYLAQVSAGATREPQPGTPLHVYFEPDTVTVIPCTPSHPDDKLICVFLGPWTLQDARPVVDRFVKIGRALPAHA